MRRTTLFSRNAKSRCRLLSSCCRLLALLLLHYSTFSTLAFTSTTTTTPVAIIASIRTTSRTANRPPPLWDSAVSSEPTNSSPPRHHATAATATATAVVPPPIDDAITITTTTAAAATAPPPPLTSSADKVYGALSMTIEELTPILGGRIGRAQLVWDCYAIGVDPALYYYHVGENKDGGTTSMKNNDGNDDDYEHYESIIRQALPSTRRKTKLGREALHKLAQTYATTATTSSVDDNTTNSPLLRVEGGVASLVHVSRSADGTTKLLLQLRDGLQVETVIIPIDKKMSKKKKNESNNDDDDAKQEGNNKRASTVCLSSQVGCRQACTFCATGRMGIQRSLTSDEILAQFYYATKLTRLYGNNSLPRINNVVFMGMGDAADNAVAVTRAVHILSRQFQLAAQKVTVSTVGPTPQAFVDLTNRTPGDALPCVLAWSVHAARDEIRQRLVPTMKARGYTVAELRNGLIRALLLKPMSLRTTMLQVTLLKNVNDSIECAEEMADLAESIVQAVLGCKLMVNLIPWNDINNNDVNNNNVNVSNGNEKKDEHHRDLNYVSSSSSSPLHYQRPSHDTVNAFQQRLWQRGIYAQVRTTRGDDATAACGQLATITWTAAAKKAAATAATTV